MKVLSGLNGKHRLPEEAHSSDAYIKLKPDGTFHEMRFYDKEHYLTFKIAYQPEPRINNGNRIENVLHIHKHKRDERMQNFNSANLISSEELYKELDITDDDLDSIGEVEFKCI